MMACVYVWTAVTLRTVGIDNELPAWTPQAEPYAAWTACSTRY